MRAFFCFLFSLIGLLSGIFSYWYFLLALPLLFYLFFYKKRRKEILVYLSFLLFFFLLVLLYPKANQGSINTYGVVIKSKDNYFLVLSLKGRFYVPMKDNEIPFLAVLHMEGELSTLSFSHYESGFSFQEYLKSQGVFAELKLTSYTISFTLLGKKNPIKNYILLYSNDISRPFIESFLFQDSLYSEESLSSLNGLGVLNLFSLSGFHLSFSFRILEKTLGEKKKKLSQYIEIVILFFFCYLSSFSYTMRRLTLLSLLKIVSGFKAKRINYLTRVSITAIIMLLVEPYSLLSASFYYVIPFLFLLAIFPRKKKKKGENPFSFFLRIQSFYLPYHLIQDGYLSFLSFAFSFLLIPYSHVLFLLSLLLIILPPISYLINPLCSFLVLISDKIQGSDFYIVSGKISLVIFLLYYLIYIFIEVLKGYHYVKQEKIVSVSLALLTSVLFVPDFTSHYEVTFIDVDQGDSTLIRYGRKNILIDTGGKKNIDLAKECLVPYFRKRKINSLDAVIITHSDLDHNGALESLEKEFIVKKVYARDDFMLSENNTLNVNGLVIQNYNIWDYSEKEDNNYRSGVYSFTIKDKSFLIMGDAPKEVEKKIGKENPELKTDVIKIGHHGSNTSSDFSFLQSLNPSLAIISCGENNKYGHPHKETTITLDALSIPYRRTDKEGSITIKV